MTKRFAVIGNPIEHSKSPQIHQAFAQQCGISLEYTKQLAALSEGGFEQTVQALIKEGYSGANVTVPFKFKALLMSHPSQIALLSKAANTLVFNSNGSIDGENTDGVGLVSDLKKNIGFDFSGKKVLLVGSGGAAWGVLFALSAENPISLTMSSRNIAMAHEMSDAAKSVRDKIQSDMQDQTEFFVKNLEELAGEDFDLVINATSSGLTHQYPEGLPENISSKNTLAYDMMYGRETPFMAQARKHGAAVADGLGMLIEQAAEAFYIWHGVRPDTTPVILQLRE